MAPRALPPVDSEVFVHMCKEIGSGCRSKRLALFVAAFLFLTTAHAAAQDAPKADLSVGYQFTHLNGSNGLYGTNLPAGWTASVTGRLTPLLNVVGEMNGAYKDGTKLHNFLSGVRFGGGPSSGTNYIVVFGQALAGLSTSGGKTGFVIQPGIGLAIHGSGKVGGRVNVDYSMDRHDRSTQKGVRVAAGVVFNFGR
jgi:hypothetical protein